MTTSIHEAKVMLMHKIKLLFKDAMYNTNQAELEDFDITELNSIKIKVYFIAKYESVAMIEGILRDLCQDTVTRLNHAFTPLGYTAKSRLPTKADFIDQLEYYTEMSECGAAVSVISYHISDKDLAKQLKEIRQQVIQAKKMPIQASLVKYVQDIGKGKCLGHPTEVFYTHRFRLGNLQSNPINTIKVKLNLIRAITGVIQHQGKTYTWSVNAVSPQPSITIYDETGRISSAKLLVERNLSPDIVLKTPSRLLAEIKNRLVSGAKLKSDTLLHESRLTTCHPYASFKEIAVAGDHLNYFITPAGVQALTAHGILDERASRSISEQLQTIEGYADLFKSRNRIYAKYLIEQVSGLRAWQTELPLFLS